jgi:hypothetical protein
MKMYINVCRNKSDPITTEESSRRLTLSYNGQLPLKAITDTMPPEMGLKFFPPFCINCGKFSQLPFGYLIKGGEIILISVCEDVKCGWIQFPRIPHLTRKIQAKLEESHEKVEIQ